jgi:hypothetical protein
MSRNFKKGQAYCGNALRCLGWIIERTTQVEEPGLESVIADLLYLAERLEKRIRLLGIDRPGVFLGFEVKADHRQTTLDLMHLPFFCGDLLNSPHFLPSPDCSH